MNKVKVVRIHRLGGPEVLEVEDIPLQKPGAGEVRIKVQAIGLNRAEAMFRMGQYLEQPVFPSRIGIAAAGVIDAVGSDVTEVRVGEKVSVATGQSIGSYGTYGESVVIPAVSAIPYPDNLTVEEAASIWVQYLTAYFAFVEVAHLQRGQFVLVTAATGGSGLGAIQVARLLGATTIATTRSPAKKQALLDAGADHVIVTGEEDLVARVKEITCGQGANLIFDSIGGGMLPLFAGTVAWGGEYILYGGLEEAEIPYPKWTAFLRNLTLRAFMVYNYCGLANVGLPRNEEAFARAKAFILDNLAAGNLKPVIAKTFPLIQIQQAHRYMESNQQLGKIVVTV